MEGKAALLEQLVGLSGVPVLLDTNDPEEIINTVARIAPTFGAIQLEDIAAPACFEITTRLDEALGMPVFHDDQHGTATVVLAATLIAVRRVGIDVRGATIGQIGLGAAGTVIAQFLSQLSDKPVLGADLSDAALQRHASAGGTPSTLQEIMTVADIVVTTTGVPGLIKPEMVRNGQIILSLSNPNPEIEPETALANGAAYALDGRAVNNLLAFPGVLRGSLDSCASRITQEMFMAAASAIADHARENDEAVPDPLDRTLHRAVTFAVARAAARSGVARHQLDEDYFTQWERNLPQ
jgi:malate dehydrogenase (oxaloacetate-decarboxylating)